MKNLSINSPFAHSFFLLLFSISMINSGCNKEETPPPPPPPPAGSYTITVDAFTLNNGTYTATGNSLLFNSELECQIWSRTAQGDAHNASSHLHYNAAANISYNETDTIFSWTEYGPELSHSDIESTCNAGQNGKNKTVETTSYYQDKPNVYLKITKIEQH